MAVLGVNRFDSKQSASNIRASCPLAADAAPATGRSSDAAGQRPGSELGSELALFADTPLYSTARFIEFKAIAKMRTSPSFLWLAAVKGIERQQGLADLAPQGYFINWEDWRGARSSART
jgi:hypothetical protein